MRRLEKKTDSWPLLIRTWGQAPHSLDPRVQWLVGWLEVGKKRQGNQYKESLPEILVGKQAWASSNLLWVSGIKPRQSGLHSKSSFSGGAISRAPINNLLLLFWLLSDNFSN